MDRLTPLHLIIFALASVLGSIAMTFLFGIAGRRDTTEVKLHLQPGISCEIQHGNEIYCKQVNR